LEKSKVLIITWGGHSLPWFGVICPEVPKPYLSKRPAVTFQVVDAKTTLLLWPAYHVPFD
jgi:hypothetical protein